MPNRIRDGKRSTNGNIESNGAIDNARPAESSISSEGGEFEVPIGVKEGYAFQDNDGKWYRNIGGKRVAIGEAELAQMQERYESFVSEVYKGDDGNYYRNVEGKPVPVTYADLEAAQYAPIESSVIIDNARPVESSINPEGGEFEVPAGVKEGYAFQDSDGKWYRNVGGKRVAIGEAELAQIQATRDRVMEGISKGDDGNYYRNVDGKTVLVPEGELEGMRQRIFGPNSESSETVYKFDGDKVEKNSVIRLVKDFLNYFKTLDKGENIALPYLDVSQKTADEVLKITDGAVDISGSRHVLTNNFVPHLERRGHLTGNEFPDSLPITEEDLQKIPEIVEEWDKIKYRKKKSADSITYTKKYPDGTVYYVEENWSGKSHKRESRLASKTMYKTRESPLFAGTTAEAKPVTSETPTPRETLWNEESENNPESQEKIGNIETDASLDADYEEDFVGGGSKLKVSRDEAMQGFAEAVVRLKSLIGEQKKRDITRRLARNIDDKIPLPPSVKRNKRGLLEKVGDLVPSMGDIRRYMSAAFDIGIRNDLDVNHYRKALGLYYNMLEAIRLRNGHYNDIEVIAHELGHHLERVLFDYQLSGLRDTALGKELVRVCLNKFGRKTYAPGLRIREGWAQFISNYLMDPERAREEAPIAFEVVESVKDTYPKIGSILNAISEMIRINQAANPTERIQSNLVLSDDVKKSPKVGLKKRLIDLYEYGNQQIADRFSALLKLQQEGNREGMNLDFYERARLVEGESSEHSAYSMETAQLDVNGNEVGKSYSDIIKGFLDEGMERGDIDAFLVARRILHYFERSGEDKSKSVERFGISYSDALKTYDKYTKAALPHAKELDKFMQNMLKMLLDGEIINQQTYDKLVKNTGYVPLHRLMEEYSAFSAGVNIGGKNPLKRFHGSDREILSPLESIPQMEQVYRSMALKNLILKDVCKTATSIQGGGYWMTPMRDRNEAVPVRFTEIAEMLVKLNTIQQWLYDEGVGNLPDKSKVRYIVKKMQEGEVIFPVIWRSITEANDKKQVITIWEDGKLVAFQCHDPLMYKAFKHMTRFAANMFNSALSRWGDNAFSVAGNIQRAGAVNNLPFVLKNIARDLQGVMVFSRHAPMLIRPAVAIINAVRFGIPAAIGLNKRLLKEWKLSGGAFGSFYQRENNAYGASVLRKIEESDKSVLEKMAMRLKELNKDFKSNKKAASWRMAKSAGRGVLNMFEFIGKVSERTARLTEFAMARREYINKYGIYSWNNNDRARRQAALDSREVSLDFEKGGEFSKQLNRYVPFFNVSNLSNVRLISELMPVDAASTIEFLKSVDWSKVYKDADEFVNFKEEGKKYLKANREKAYRSFGVVLSIMALYSIMVGLSVKSFGGDDEEREKDDDNKDFDDLNSYERRMYANYRIGDEIVRIPLAPELAPFYGYINSMTWNIFHPKNAVDFAGLEYFIDALPNVVPPPLVAAIEWLSGYSLFKRRQIESTSQKNLLPSSRAYPTTSSTNQIVAKLISKKTGMEISPIMLDSLVTSLFAGVGRDIMRYGSDPVARWLAGAPEKPDPGNAGYLGVGAFFRSPYTPSVYVQKFNDMANEAQQLVKTYNQSQIGKISGREFSERQNEMLIWYRSRIRYISRIQQAIGAINNQIKMVQNSTEADAKSKADTIKEYRKEIDKVCKNAYNELDFRKNNKK